MLLNFKNRFAQFVKEGSKTHTIRAERKPHKLGYAVRAPRVGETVHSYTGLRQKGAKLLGRFQCVKVERITITEFFNKAVPLAVSIDGHLLSSEETNLLFKRDGFRDLSGETHQHIIQAHAFWKDKLPFKGYIIHWKYPGVTK